MKVGILTFHKSINYGSVLQCWALRDILVKHGYDVEVIDYEPDSYYQQYGLYQKGRTKHNVNVYFASHWIKRQNNLFAEFRERTLNLSKEKYKSSSNFSSLNKYDVIICGSDQIWNLKALDCDPIYFLPFHTAGRKVAYAVSINDATYKEEKATDDLRKEILNFDYISEREKSGADKLENFIHHEKKVDTCLDPTLLHKKSDFDSIVSERVEKEPYIFLYNVWSGHDGFNAASRLSKRLNLPAYTGFMGRTLKSIVKVESRGIKVEKKYTSPSDYISLIKNAEWVVTDSFHGTAFSLIFEKQFISVNEVNPEGTKKNDERLTNILGQLGLLDRYITVDDVDSFNLNMPIDFRTVTAKRMKMADESIHKLISAIEGSLNS